MYNIHSLNLYNIDLNSFVYCTNRLFQVSTTRSSEAISDCGDVQLYSWGSLRPVYSPSKRRIYKNKACAACHGVSDGSEWTSGMQCKDIDELVNVESYLNNVQGFQNRSCSVHFLYDGKSDDILHLKCFKDLISECYTEYYSILMSRVTNVSVETLNGGCRGGLLAPVLNNDRWYANGFCATCNILRVNSCYQQALYRTPDSGSFFSILDTSMFSTDDTTEAIRTQTIRQACPADFKVVDFIPSLHNYTLCIVSNYTSNRNYICSINESCTITDYLLSITQMWLLGY